jgi:hypothetical protein
MIFPWPLGLAMILLYFSVFSKFSKTSKYFFYNVEKELFINLFTFTFFVF